MFYYDCFHLLERVWNHTTLAANVYSLHDAIEALQRSIKQGFVFPYKIVSRLVFDGEEKSIIRVYEDLYMVGLC